MVSQDVLRRVSFAGVAYDVLHDRSYAIPPLTGTEVDRLIEEAKASRILAVDDQGVPLDLGVLRDLVGRAASLAADLPEVAHLAVRPVVVSANQTAVLGAAVEIRPPGSRIDEPARRLLG